MKTKQNRGGKQQKAQNNTFAFDTRPPALFIKKRSGGNIDKGRGKKKGKRMSGSKSRGCCVGEAGKKRTQNDTTHETKRKQNNQFREEVLLQKIYFLSLRLS